MSRRFSYRFLPSTERLAEIVRRTWNVRVGIAGVSGVASWIGERQGVIMSVCAPAVEWIEKVISTRTLVRADTDAGMRLFAMPLWLDGACDYAVFAIGKWNASKASEEPILIDILSEISQEISETIQKKEVSSVHLEAIDSEWIARDPAMESVLRGMHLAMSDDFPVLLVGERGTGKDLVSRLIHRHSDRSGGPYLEFHSELYDAREIESELFGYKRGAFPDAFMDKPGLLEIAHGGTLYLDNVDGIPRATQSKILSFLREGAFTPAGDCTSHHVDVRVMASMRRSDCQSARDAIDAGFYYALAVHEIALPRLRDRREDIEPLCQIFLQAANRRNGRGSSIFSEEAMERLRGYDWPGNLHELECEMNRLSVIAKQPVISGAMLGRRFENVAQKDATKVDHFDANLDWRSLCRGMDLPTALEKMERDMISSALRENDGNRTKTAEILGVSRRNLIRKIESLKIDD